MRLVDTHCHLHREEFDVDRDQIVSRAREEGVEILLDPATTLASNRTVADLTRRFPEVYGAAGIHPHHADEVTPAVIEELERIASDPRMVAIGEIGLDYYRNLCPAQIQREALRQLLALSRRLDRPVILHCREAYADLFPILREVLPVPMEKVVLETDAPFLAPQQRRGQRNEPAFLHELVQTWARLRGMTEEEVARRTTENARRLFGFPADGAGDSL